MGSIVCPDWRFGNDWARAVRVSVKSVSKAPAIPTGLSLLPIICREFRSEPPRTRTWNLEIKSLFR
jgi:hypothetical protein